MRRARVKLQVSTFPFLAVLLAAMGALIFLLLVIDRRAKLVARNKVRETWEARQKEKADRDAERLAAWQREQDEYKREEEAFHERLRQQDLALREALHQKRVDLESTQANLKGLESKLKREEQEALRLLQEQEALRKWLTDSGAAVEARRHAGKLTQQQQEEADRVLARMTVELARMEKILNDLKARPKRDNVFSLVPYRGKHGSDRKPIYVECNSDGIVFQPGGRRLSSLLLERDRIREEIKHCGLNVALKKLEPEESLIPVRTEKKTEPYLLCLVRPDGVQTYGYFLKALQGCEVDFGYELIDADWELDFANEGIAGTESLQDGVASPKLAMGSTLPGGKRPGGTGIFVPVGSGSGPGGGKLPGGGMMPGGGKPGGGILPGKAGTQPLAGAPTGSPLLPHPGPGLPGGSLGPPVAGGKGPTSLRERSEGKGPGGGEPEKKGPAGDVTWKGTGMPGKDGEPGEKKEPREGEPGGGTTDYERPLPQDPFAKPSPRPVSLGHMLGNRDFILHIICLENEAILKLTGERFSVEGSAAEQSRSAQELADKVQKTIARRQASLRSGEPPYRPILRFQVHPGGLRSYYRVYPLLETLRVPMQRENIEP